MARRVANIFAATILMASAAQPLKASTVGVVIAGVACEIAEGVVNYLAQLCWNDNVNIGVDDRLTISSTPRKFALEFQGSVLNSRSFSIQTQGIEWSAVVNLTLREDADLDFADDDVAVGESYLQHVVPLPEHPGDAQEGDKWDIPLLSINADSDDMNVQVGPLTEAGLVSHPEGHEDAMKATLSGTSYDGNFSVFTFRLNGVHEGVAEVPLPPALGLLGIGLGGLLVARQRRRSTLA